MLEKPSVGLLRRQPARYFGYQDRQPTSPRPGDVRELADGIAELGLLHPIVVRPDGRLITGCATIARPPSTDHLDSALPPSPGQRLLPTTPTPCRPL